MPGLESIIRSTSSRFGARDREARDALQRAAAFHVQLTNFLAWSRGDLKSARKTCRQARALFDEIHDSRRAALASNALAWIEGAGGNLAGQLRIGEEVLAWAQRNGDRRTTVQALITTGGAALQMGRFGVARELFDQATAAAESLDLRRQLRLAQCFTSALSALAGDGISCDQTTHDSAPLVAWLGGDYQAATRGRHPQPVPLRRAWALPFIAMAHAAAGDLAEARAITAELRFRSSDARVLQALTGWARARISWREGKLQRAAAELEASATSFYTMQAFAFAPFVLFDLAELGTDARLPEIVHEAARKANAIADCTGAGIHRALSHATAAWSGLETADRTHAVELARSATDTLLASNLYPYLARALTLLSRLLAPIDRLEAIRCLEDAAQYHARSGVTWRVDQTLALLRKLGYAGRRSAAVRRGANSLTRREREVVRLAAEGRTTAEIAGALFVTNRTVESHLANAYAKLGVRTRNDLSGLRELLDGPSSAA